MTYYKDLPELPYAWDYQAERSRLGHNTRLIHAGKRVYRVYFSAGMVNTEVAINVKDVPKQ